MFRLVMVSCVDLQLYDISMLCDISVLDFLQLLHMWESDSLHLESMILNLKEEEWKEGS